MSPELVTQVTGRKVGVDNWAVGWTCEVLLHFSGNGFFDLLGVIRFDDIYHIDSET